MIGYIAHYEFSLAFAFIMTAFAGITDAAFNTTVLAILGFQFDSKTTPFSVYYFVQSIGIFAIISFESLLKT